MMKTMCPPVYHHNDYVATHALGHMMCIYIYIYIYIYERVKIYICNIYIYIYDNNNQIIFTQIGDVFP